MLEIALEWQTRSFLAYNQACIADVIIINIIATVITDLELVTVPAER